MTASSPEIAIFFFFFLGEAHGDLHARASGVGGERGKRGRILRHRQRESRGQGKERCSRLPFAFSCLKPTAANWQRFVGQSHCSGLESKMLPGRGWVWFCTHREPLARSPRGCSRELSGTWGMIAVILPLKPKSC